jgi:hypothetical protein
MNPSWITGKMPKDQYKHEHPLHFDEAVKDEEDYIKRELKTIKGLKEEKS